MEKKTLSKILKVFELLRVLLYTWLNLTYVLIVEHIFQHPILGNITSWSALSRLFDDNNNIILNIDITFKPITYPSLMGIYLRDSFNFTLTENVMLILKRCECKTVPNP